LIVILCQIAKKSLQSCTCIMA